MPPVETLSIREANLNDSERLILLMRELARYERLEHTFDNSAADLEQWLFHNPIAGCQVAEVEGSVAAYAVYFRTFSTFLGKPGFWLEDIYVTPEHRGQGIGKALLRHLAGKAVASESGRLEWAVLDWNQTAIEFYGSIGAEILSDWRLCRLHGDALAQFARSS